MPSVVTYFFRGVVLEKEEGKKKWRSGGTPDTRWNVSRNCHNGSVHI